MKVFVVLEEDCGCGVRVAAVFASLEAAQAFVAKEGSRYYLDSESGDKVQG
jgi:hypothetical protein